MSTIPPPPLSDQDVADLLKPKAFWEQQGVIKSLIIALLSTIVIFGGIAFTVGRSEGWGAVQQAFFSRPDMRAAFPKVWEGFQLNIKMFMIAEPLVLAFGLILALIRIGTNPVLFPVRAIAIAYIDLFRGAPALLVIMMLGFGMPGLRISWLPNDPVFWGITACVITSSAYTAETFRAGIESVHRSQRSAARSLGLSNRQTFQHVVLPQGIKAVIPPLISGFVSLQKETALVSTIGPLEATRRAQIYSALNFNYSSYVIAALLFIALTIPLARFTDYLLQRSAKRMQMGGLA
ncbi:MAG: amino acid ABC transporter permease [Thermomicrobiales bacterium]|nr:amino acid ABC transporter permease [Thermomicrobiales bacterium]MCO5219627.1 amino acid ABC transporter permease [Thermomicrobiales bacterium]MCO5224708.1 amino acid ABC transporter permease [Thermomicrobiales bacterium]MCO5228818.1 amino acid ABC transporter permease [Thermomicrobiales bacterium]